MARPAKQHRKLTLTLREAQDVTGLSRTAIWRLLKDGTLQKVVYPACKRSVFISADSVQAMFERGRAEAINAG